MKSRKTAGLAWALCAAVVAGALVSLVLTWSEPNARGDPFAAADTVLNAVFAVAFAVVGALILSRQARNRIGWLLMVVGLSIAVVGSLGTTLGRNGSALAAPTTTTYLEAWLSSWSWWLLIGPLLLILLLFPTGRLLSPRWRGVVLLIALLFATFILMATVSPEWQDPSTGKSLPNPLAVAAARSKLSFATIQLPWTVALVGAVALCVLSVFMRYRRSAVVERQQLKWFLYACALFIATYAGAGLLFIGVDPPSWVGALFSFVILLLPLSIGIAILRYRLYDIDIIIRRTLVYVPLTAILAGVFAASIKVTQTLFAGVAGRQSEAATVLTTLIVVAAFDPLKGWLQRTIDARFKEGADRTQRWKEYGKQVKAFVEMNDAEASVRRLLEEAAAVFETTCGAVYLRRAGEMLQVHTIGDWRNAPEATIGLEHQGLTVGSLSLGARRSGRPFDPHDLALLADTAGAVAAAITLGKNPRG